MYQENCEKQIEYQKRRYKKNSALQIEYKKTRYQKNPEILKENIKKEVPRKNKRMRQGSEFPAISKTRALLYLHNMPSKLVSTLI